MKRYFSFMLLFFFGIVYINAQSQKNQILITNVHIFNGVDDQILDGNILITDNKVSRVSEKPISVDKKSTVIIDGRNKYLIPGLIDAHAHLVYEDWDGDLGNAMDADWGLVNLYATQAAHSRLLRGYTTLRNMGGNAIPLSRAIDRGVIWGPRVFPSGAFISQSGGHGDFFETTAVPRTLDKLSYAEITGQTAIADGVPEVLRRVREQLRQGATQIKMMAGGGIMSDYDPIDVSEYTVEEFKAAVSAAENFDTYVATHVYTPKAIQMAIKGGVKSIEHGHLMDEETARIMAEKGIWLSIQPFVGESNFPKGSDKEKKWNQVVSGTDNAYKLAKKYGIKTAWGTDATGSGAATRQSARIIALKKWFTPYEILKMITSNNAELLEMSGKRNPYQEGPLGEITAGAYADLILVDGNPLENIDLIADPENNFVLIMKDGVIYKNKLE